MITQVYTESQEKTEAGSSLDGCSGPLRSSLKRNFAWAFAGNAVYGACQWAALAVLARMGRPEQVGTYALGVAICTPVFMLANLSLREIQSTDARGEFEFGQYAGLRLATTAVAVLAICVGAFGAGYRRETSMVVLLVAIGRGVEYLADAIYGLLQRNERMDRISKSLILHGSVCVLAFSAVFWWKRSLAWAVTSAAISGSLALLYDVRSPRLVGESWPGVLKARVRPGWLRGIVRLAWLGLPLGSVMMLLSLTVNVPRYFVERYWGARELGVFAAMAYFMQAGTTFVVALGQSANARLARHFADGNQAGFEALLGKLLGVGALLGIGGVVVAILAGRPLLAVLYGKEYALRNGVLVWLMAAAGVSYISGLLGFAMTAMRLLRILPLIFLCTCVVSLAGCYCLVPRLGLQGAALASLCAAAAQAIGSAAIVYRGLADGTRAVCATGENRAVQAG